ncbi:MAG: NAD(P)/FAD-dependent oxidoreductase [Opitutaceae bacterium]|nr:NAD(P)/FAD-dependent oxidoreductase [Opitutaceae bacterium]
MNSRSHYDVVILGAGMSGLAAGIRLAHFGRRVCIFERHNAVGGLNGFYSIAGRKFDVGLHAVTNYVRPGVKGTPLGKLFRQLRIDREEFALCEQKQSRIAFGPQGEVSLRFTNDFVVLESEIAAKFPGQIDGFRRLLALVRTHDDVSLEATPLSARAVVREHITDPLLEDMLLCPLMYYGSSQPGDMEFGQFVIMFKAIFLEGFARPLEGVRVILRVLLEKYREAGGERRMKCGVSRLRTRGDRVVALQLDSGEEITADHVISSIGLIETRALIDGSGVANSDSTVSKPGSVRLSFAETITIMDRQPAQIGWDMDTIVFFNDTSRLDYNRPEEAVDLRSGVVCFPNNFLYPDNQYLAEGIFRVTCLANFCAWERLLPEEYREAKGRWFAAMQRSAKRFLPQPTVPQLKDIVVTTDMFTPLTVRRFTGHVEGAIYGAPEKIRTGRTDYSNLYLCGTDQGFLGIIGAMLSGISMANYHILAKSG